MKILFVSHVANFQKFNKPYMLWFKEQGWTVDYASSNDEPIENADNFYSIDFRRNPLNPKNFKALRQMIRLLKSNQYDIIHCHTPVGAMVTRLAALFSPESKVIYTAHGFHFFKGAPLLNNLVYKTVERFLARFTDVLVTINNEDYNAAQKFHLKKGGRVCYLKGVGVDTSRYANAAPDKDKICAGLGINPSSFIVLTVGEFIKRKNYQTSIPAFAKADIPNSVYLICGKGRDEEQLKQLCKDYGVEDRVIFMGYRKDIEEIVKISDIFMLVSWQEGLPLAVVEAMAGGLPIIGSDIRGTNELVTNNGFLHKPDDVNSFAEALKKLYSDNSLKEEMGRNSAANSLEYDIHNSVVAMAEIYSEVIKSCKNI